jgi:hypothetical protein
MKCVKYRLLLFASLLLLAVLAPVPASASPTAYGPSRETIATLTLNGRTPGFTLEDETKNADGSVTATWQTRSGKQIFYLGPPSAHVSVTQTVSYTKAGKRQQSQLVGISSTTTGFTWATGATSHGTSKEDRIGLAQSVAGDAMHGKLPGKIAQAFAREVSARPDICGSSCTIVNSTCISFFDEVNVSVNGCDNRYKLQNETGNYYIADDMETQAYVAPFEFVDLTKLDVWMVYKYSAYNTITHIEPTSPVQTNCSGGNTYSFSWFGVSLSSAEVTCSGTMSPWGLSSYKGGGYWAGSLGNGEVTTEPILLDHSTSHLSPESTMWISEGSTATSQEGSCPTGGKCG